MQIGPVFPRATARPDENAAPFLIGDAATPRLVPAIRSVGTASEFFRHGPNARPLAPIAVAFSHPFVVLGGAFLPLLALTVLMRLRDRRRL